MATRKTTPKPLLNPTALAQYRQVENFRPGWWWLGTYEDEHGTRTDMWTQADVIMHGEQIGTGLKTVRVYGTCTDGENAQLHVERGTQVKALTERDGRRCGLETAEAPAGEATGTQ